MRSAILLRALRPAFCRVLRWTGPACACFFAIGLAARLAAPARAQEATGAPVTVAERPDVARFRERAEMELAKTGADKGTWGILVTDADSGEIIYAVNPSHYFLPASNAKLFATAMAMGTLGPDFRIRTTVVGSGTLSGGRLQGDLVLRGAGDANLSNRVFPFSGKEERAGPRDKVLGELADQVVARGVKEISGDVVADDSYLDRGRFPSGWTVDDSVWSYGAAVSAIAVNDNVVTLNVQPGKTVGAPLEFSLEPKPSIYEARNEGGTTSARPVPEPQIWLAREPESRLFTIGGSLPRGTPVRPLELAVQEPAENAAVLLAHLLEARGVQITGKARARHFGDVAETAEKRAAAQVLAEHLSPTLTEDVRLTNKLSLNLHAELMLRVAAREKADAMTLDEALKFAEKFRKDIGIEKEEVELSDGSGLSRDDLVTPQAMVKLLTWAARQPWAADFRASLPSAGEDGTLENRMKGTAAVGRVQAKTGTVNHVEGLSGYATTERGEHLIFAIFGNGNGMAIRDAVGVVDAICVAMVEELGAGK